MRPYDRVLEYDSDVQRNPYAVTKWFSGGQTNTCYNALDRHMPRLQNKTALIYDSPLSGGVIEHWTYGDLLSRVKLLAGVLRHKFGVRKGDTVMIYMPMIPDAIVAMLACQRIGAIHSVVFGGFSGHELAYRVKDARSKLILCANVGVEPGPKIIDYKRFVDHAISELAKDGIHDMQCLVYHRDTISHSIERQTGSRVDFPVTPMTPGRDFDWEDELKNCVQPVEECVPVDANDPAYVLYTSGTTGTPKGVVRPTGGHLVALQYSMYNIFGVKPDDIMFAASDIGWVVGHSYIAYGPLIHGSTGVLYEGKPVATPDANAYWRLISQHKVNSVFAAPTAWRAIRKEDPSGAGIKKFDLSSLNSIFVAGERCDPETLKWISQIFDNKIPVLDNWWQTETGWPICSKMLGLKETKPLDIVLGSCYTPIPGYDVQIVEISEERAETLDSALRNEGQVVIKLPLPPGTLSGLWNTPERYRRGYLETYPGYYNTGDAGHFDKDGNCFIMSRTDDIINVAAHRLSTSEMEQVLTMNRAVSEGAVVGMLDDVKGEVPVGFIVLNNGVTQTHQEIERECVRLIRQEIGPLACFKHCIVVKKLPKTRSGKILRVVLKKMLNNQPYKVPATIEDESVLEEVRHAIDTTKLT